METLYASLITFILANVIVGGVRIAIGPTRGDRMLASQFLGTAAVAMFLLLSELLDEPAIRNLALVFVALAAITTLAFVRAYGAGESTGSHE
jgi:multicomponent Na+:H+ antiporter subunit F